MQIRFACRGAIAMLLMLSGAVGCQTYRAPGALLPSLAASQQDRSIEKFAESSGFPSPSDVGLSAEEQ